MSSNFGKISSPNTGFDAFGNKKFLQGTKTFLESKKYQTVNLEEQRERQSVGFQGKKYCNNYLWNTR